MNKNRILGLAAVFAAVGIVSCTPEVEIKSSPTPSAGEADFTTYVALGNSLTAGYADGQLNRSGQINSYPALLAESFRSVNPSLTFNQPLMPEGRLNETLVFSGFQPNGSPILAQEEGGLGPEAFASISGQGPFQNLGVPGATVGSLLLQGYGSLNPYYGRFAEDNTLGAGSSIIADAAAQQPTFFTLWIGNNDVLGYATSGGEEGAAANPLRNSITPTATFKTYYEGIIATLIGSNNSIEGALANIPDIENIPFFQTVQWDDFELTVELATAANAGLEAGFKAVVAEQAVRQAVIPAINALIIPGVAREAVKQQIASSEPCSSSGDAQTCAEAAIQTGAFDNQINGLRDILITEYAKAPADRNTDYSDAYAAISNIYETQVSNTLAAYNAGTLPDAQQQALEQGINQATQDNIAALKSAGLYPTFVEGPNGFLVDRTPTQDNPLTFRQLTAEDLVTLRVASAPASDFNPTGGDIILPGTYVLDAAEQQKVRDAIEAYNDIIEDVATTNTFALVDANSLFDKVVTSGITTEGLTFSNSFITGNAFSLDGVHLTPRGYALVATYFIDAINSYYKAELPKPSVRDYDGVILETN